MKSDKLFLFLIILISLIVIIYIIYLFSKNYHENFSNFRNNKKKKYLRNNYGNFGYIDNALIGYTDNKDDAMLMKGEFKFGKKLDKKENNFGRERDRSWGHKIIQGGDLGPESEDGHWAWDPACNNNIVDDSEIEPADSRWMYDPKLKKKDNGGWNFDYDGNINEQEDQCIEKTKIYY